jgi:integrase
MKGLLFEIKQYHSQSGYSEGYKCIINRRLDEFICYLAEVTNTTRQDLHLEKIYETVNVSGETLFYSQLDAGLIDQYFQDHLHKSYSWLEESKRALQSFFRYLYRKYDFPILTDQILFNVDDHKQKPQKKDKYVPTRHDLLRFLQELLKTSSFVERDTLFFLMLISTGSRPSEILKVKLNEIDLINETVYCKKTKNNSSKFIILRSGFGSVLERYILKNNLKGEDFLFNDNGIPMSLKDYQEVFKTFLKRANVPFTTLHKLRHSFATIMAESGAEVTVIQQLLGHKKIHSTSNYIDPNYIRNLGMELKVNKEVYKCIRNIK